MYFRLIILVTILLTECRHIFAKSTFQQSITPDSLSTSYRRLFTIMFVSMTIIILVILKFNISYLKKKMVKEKYFADSIIDNAGIFILVWDLDGSLILFNRYAEETTGFKSNEVMGIAWLNMIIPQETRPETISVFEKIKSGELPIDYENKILCKNGKKIAVMWNHSILYNYNKEPNLIVLMGIDITERKNAQDKINHMAYYDCLTDLPNRMLFLDRLKSALALARRKKHMLALMFIDMDNFKTINDTFGHYYGDMLLKKAGHKIKKCLREIDTVARLSGDEFVILIPQIDQAEDALIVAKRVLNSFQQPWKFQGKEFCITTSIGIAIYPNDGEDEQTLMRSADNAMYRAKETGKNNFQLYHPIKDDKFEQLEIN